MKYIIITPAKDEEKYIKYTLESVCGQTLKPYKWIIVDDGSLDNTAAVVKEFQNRYSWISFVEKRNTMARKLSGPKVIRAFNYGYNTLTIDDYEFMVKLDADLILPNDYFEKVSNAFQENSKIGLCGGYLVTKKNGKLIKERAAENHIRGAFKAYRNKCFEEIGGLKPILGWDALDEMTANYLGWEIKQLPLQVIHLRETRRDYEPLLHRFHSGMVYFRMGYGVFLTLLKSLFWVCRKPYIIGGISFIVGFVTSFIRGDRKIGDKDLRKFFRGFKYDRILQFLHLK